MTASTAKLPVGSKFLIGDGGSPTEAFTAAINVKSIGISGGQADEIDVTHLDSSAGFREYISGFKDAGELELGLMFDPSSATHAISSRSLYELFKSGITFNWRIDVPWGSATYRFSGSAFIKSEPKINLAPDSPAEGTVTIRRTGPTTLALVP